MGAHASDKPSSFLIGAIDFVAGALGGVACVYSAQPFDTIKVKMQSFPHLYTNMIDCLVKTYKKDGFVRGLYAGTTPALIANIAENSVLFAAYGGCQNVVAKIVGKESTKQLSVIENGFSGFLAAFFSTFALCPTELIKCRMQALREMGELTDPEKAKKITPYQLTKSILKTEGVPGMFRGLTPTFAREMPGYFFFFGGYEAARELLKKPGQTKDDIGPLNTMIAGACGGVCLWVMIFPADVIKSRIQINNLQRGMFSMGFEIARTEGLLALYNGLLPTIIRTIPATASLFIAYEYSKKYMEYMLT